MAYKHSVWQIKGTYIEVGSPTGYDVLIKGSNKYLNFGTTTGNLGYGIRDNGGAMEVKDSGGTWRPIDTSASSVDLTSDVTNILPIANGGTGSATQNFVDLTTPQSVAGIKTFSSFPVTPSTDPTSDYQVANKKYVDEKGLITFIDIDTDITINASQLGTVTVIDIDNSSNAVTLQLPDPSTITGKQIYITINSNPVTHAVVINDHVPSEIYSMVTNKQRISIAAKSSSYIILSY